MKQNVFKNISAMQSAHLVKNYRVAKLALVNFFRANTPNFIKMLVTVDGHLVHE